MQGRTRRGLVASGLVASGLGAVVAGCADARLAGGTLAGAARVGGDNALRPLDLSPENLVRITVCTRPFRPAGPRLETETVNGRTVIHNYGHGGSGWSLAWGYAGEAARLAGRHSPRAVAVLGAGAMGLTTAIALAETGARVTIYAREFPMEAPSARATGVWSPSSRIGFAERVAPGFAERWEALARRSYARHLAYVGRGGHPVEFTPRFYLRSQTREPTLVQPPEGAESFLHLDGHLRGLEPPWSDRPGTPFPAGAGVRGGLVMTFNIAEYTRQLTQDFQAMGGRMECANVASLAELARLPGDLVVNCAGFDARALAGDATLVPVRGQIAWLAPQEDRLYGVFHRNVMALSRRDGVLIQELGGNDWFGYGDASETPDRDEFLAARAKIAPMFEWG